MAKLVKGFGIIDPNEPTSFRDVQNTCAYGDTAIRQFYVDLLRSISTVRLTQSDIYYRTIRTRPRFRESYVEFYDQGKFKLKDVERVLEDTLGRASAHYQHIAPDAARKLTQAKLKMKDVLKYYRDNPKTPSIRDSYLKLDD